MKKRLLTVLLAVCLVVALGTVTAAADDTTVTSADELKSAIENARDGDVITLGADIVLDPDYGDFTVDPEKGPADPYMTITSDITVDLDGHRIGWDISKVTELDGTPTGIPYTLLIFDINNASVTFCGDGVIDAEANFNNSYCINVNGGELTIEDGTYYGAMTAVQVQEGKLKIFGGTFDLAETIKMHAPNYSKYLINCIDSAYESGETQVAIIGGTYVGFDPTKSPEKGEPSYVPNGVEIETSSDGYAVIANTTPGNDSVAVVNRVYYNKLEDAISAALKGDTVTLVDNVAEDINVEESKVITLDLAGKTLTSPSDSMVYGELTIEDSSNSTGTFVSDKSVRVDGGILTLESGTINIKNDYGIYCLNDGTAIVNGGKIESLYASLNGNNTTGDMNFTVNGGELTAQYGPAIYMPGQGVLTITDGVLNGGISLRMGQVNISGGTIYATNGSIDSPSEFYNYSGNAWLPDALYVFNGTYGSENDKKGNSLNINITGGEFICENGQGSAVAIYDLGKVAQNSEVKISDDATLVTNASDRDAYQVLSLSDIGVGTPELGYGHTAGEVGSSISGGTFSTAVDKEYLDSSINYELSSNGKFTYYTTLAEAMAAANDGDTINFVGDESAITVHTVTFVNNGVKTTVEVTDSITLPNPDSRNGYTFGGWRYGNTVYKAGETVKVTSDMTFTAIWNAINIPDTYDIDLIVGEGGEAKTNFSNASAGTTITITVTPDEGYELDYITVDGERISGTTFKMPDHDVTVRVYFTDGSSTLPFTDVTANQWFYDAVAYVYTNGMMEGDSATTFNPDGRMTRAMFWAVLGRIDGATITGANWVETARSWAMAEGVSDGTNPNDYVTREMMVTMLWRYAGEPASEESLSGYSDAANVSDWAAEAMSWALETGVIEGVTATTLQPQGTATRAQCATIFMRYDALVA